MIEYNIRDCASPCSTASEISIYNANKATSFVNCVLFALCVYLKLILKITVVRILWAARHTPILALSENLDTQEKLNLFHTGVDVFLEKPVNADICAAQANKLIKLYLESDENLVKSIPVAFGTSLVVVPQYCQVLVQGTPIEFDLLYFMAKHPGRVFSRKELYDYVWDDYYEL